MSKTRSLPRPTLWPSPKPPLCPRLPWRARPRHLRPGLLSCARTRRRISSPAASPGQDIDQGSWPCSPTAWRAAGPQTDLVPLADPRGKPGPRPPPPIFGRVRREVSSPASVHRDFDASAAPGLYIEQAGASQMLVRAVDIVGQMATNGFADLARLEVRYDLVVHLCSGHVPVFAYAHPCADMVPNTAGIHQYRGHVCAHGGGQVALLAKSF